VAGPAFGPIVGFRFIQWVWMTGVWSIAWQALWGVVPPERRAQARAFVEGGPMQWGAMAAGILLLVSDHFLTARALFAACTVVAVASVAAAWP
jgi:hypothetical protein